MISADGRVIVPFSSDQIDVRTANGMPLWIAQYTNYVLNPPAVAADGSLSLTFGNTGLMRISRDGLEAQNLELGGYCQAVAPPVLDAEGTVYFPCGNSLIATRANGSNKWAVWLFQCRPARPRGRWQSLRGAFCRRGR